MVTPDVFVFADSPDGSFGETIKIDVDVTHPIPVTLAVFPASTVMMRLNQHMKEIHGVQEHLLEVPIQEESGALRDRLDVDEEERAILRATVRTMGVVETVLRNRMRDERQTRIKIERQLASDKLGDDMKGPSSELYKLKELECKVEVFGWPRLTWSKKDRCGHFKDQNMDCGACNQLVGEGGVEREVTAFNISVLTLVFDTFLASTAVFVFNGVTQRSFPKKKKGKQSQNNMARKIEGVKINKPKSTFVYRPKVFEPARTMETEKEDIDLFKLKNEIDSFCNKDDTIVETDVGESRMHKLVTCGVPWTLMGDFNVALNLEDYSSSSSKLSSAISEFKECVYDIKVIDITSFGLHFTWNQKPKDHLPAVLHIPNLPFTKSKPFKIFNFLIHKSQFKEVVSNARNKGVEGHKRFQVVSKLKSLKKPFWKLLHNHGNLHDRVNKIKAELDTVQKALDLNPNDVNLQDEEAVYVQAFVEAKLDEERPVIDDEIKSAMFSIGDDRAPGPDGFLSFFSKRGGILSVLMCVMPFMIFFLNGKLLKEINHTFLALIPKEVVSDNQSAFVLGRRISDNILITKYLCITIIGIEGLIDDLFIFARGDVESARVIMEALEEFKSTSGLVLSFPKSTAFFCNVPNHIKLAILNIMPFFEGELPVKYLGIPLISSNSQQGLQNSC
nr:hypothetical protein [Tanacetum cinerariifolium]